MTVEDPEPVREGSPGLIGYSPIDIYYDNVPRDGEPMTRQALILATAALLAFTATAAAQDVAMFGNTPSRNMVSDDTGIVSEWDVDTGTNVLWSQPVGSQAYGGPVVANGRVYVGTNNEGRRDPAIEGDKGVVMAFDAATGDFIWQMVHPKLSSGRVNDWPLQGGLLDRLHGGRPHLLRVERGARRLPGRQGTGRRQRRPLHGRESRPGRWRATSSGRTT